MDRTVPQHAFTVQTRIGKDRVAELSALLDGIGDDIKGNPYIPFPTLDRLHYASFVVFDADPDDPFLVFEGNVDGPVPDFLRQMVRSGPGLNEIYRHCDGCPDSGPDALVDYLLEHDIGASAFFVAWPGHTVATIREEQLLHERISAFLDEQRASSDIGTQPPAEVRRRIQEFVGSDPELAPTLKRRPQPFLVRFGPLIAAALVLRVVVAVLKVVAAALSPRSGRTKRLLARATLLVLGGVVGVLRIHELRDDRRVAARTPDWQTRYNESVRSFGHVLEREDHQLQNHLASLTTVKPGRFRLAVLNVVFALVTVTVRLVANRGKLGFIGSVHFARWVLTPDKRSVIFLSNFDGSWESYLNDFIDLAFYGLNAVWSNTDNPIGFPPTRFLVLGGSQDEQRFKAYARVSQFRSRVWYSAYPDLTVPNIRTNMKIRNKLLGRLDDDGTDAWLRLL